MPRLVDKSLFLMEVEKRFGKVNSVTRDQAREVASWLNMPNLPAWLVQEPARRISRGVYALTELGVPRVKPAPKTKLAPVAPPIVPDMYKSASNTDAAMHGFSEVFTETGLIPEKMSGYVPFGHFNDVRSVISSRRFFPVFVTGLSGNGKTDMISQICAQESREFVRANITRQSDEDDLIGGFRLINGNTVWQDGPVIIAMERGAILLLDEVDLGDAKLMCLQPVLEGKPIYVKAVNKVVHAAPGFNILATANTKGKGSSDGRFVGTNILNDAFLDRFAITFEQEFPPEKVEVKILNNLLNSAGVNAGDFPDRLVQWANVTRLTYASGSISELISLRRLTHIIQAYIVFGQNRAKAIELCINRFDEETKVSFLETYKKIDAEWEQNTTPVQALPEVPPDTLEDLKAPKTMASTINTLQASTGASTRAVTATSSVISASASSAEDAFSALDKLIEDKIARGTGRATTTI